VLGAVADERAEIGIGTIRGRVGDVVEIPVSIVADDYVVAWGLDLIFPAELVEHIIGGRFPQDMIDRDWHWGGDNSRILNDQLYVRCGAFEGGGIQVDEGENVQLWLLKFRIKSAGNGEAIVWQGMDNIGWYHSDAPMPYYDSTAHVWGCYRSGQDQLGISREITYGTLGRRHAAHVYADLDLAGDFSLDVSYPLWCDWIYGAPGWRTTTYESVTVSQIAPGLLRIVGIMGAGHPNPDDNWGQIARVDFVPRRAGELGHWGLGNFTGALEGHATACGAP